MKKVANVKEKLSSAQNMSNLLEKCLLQLALYT